MPNRDLLTNPLPRIVTGQDLLQLGLCTNLGLGYNVFGTNSYTNAFTPEKMHYLGSRRIMIANTIVCGDGRCFRHVHSSSPHCYQPYILDIQIFNDGDKTEEIQDLSSNRWPSVLQLSRMGNNHSKRQRNPVLKRIW